MRARHLARLGLRLTRAELAQLRRAARASDLDVSTFVRRAVRVAVADVLRAEAPEPRPVGADR